MESIGTDRVVGTGVEASVAGTSSEAAGGTRLPGDAWERIMKRLRSELGEDIFSSWFGRMRLDTYDGATVTLSVPTSFLKSWIRANYLTRIVALWQEEPLRVERVDLRVRAVEKRVLAKPVAAQPARPVLPRAGVTAQPRNVPAGVEGAPFDARHRFEALAVGRGNSIAVAAARQIASALSGDRIAYNPLFIHGGVGRGKTHILHAIGWEASEKPGGRRILHLSAQEFVFRFVNAIRSDGAIAFKERLREIDLLLIDDIQFMAGKATQREFCHTVNALIESGRQVVVVADRPPGELAELDERMRSRLAGGLVCEIGPLDPSMRREILNRRLAELGRDDPTFVIGDDVIDYIAAHVTGDGRDLEGSLNRLAAFARFSGEPVTLAYAERAIRDIVIQRERPQVRIENIQRAVAQHFRLSRQDLISSRRTQAVVRPRQIAMYLAKQMTLRSLPEIGKRFGNRDHTTVLHAVRKIEGLIAQSDDLAREVAELRRLIQDLED
ncbi:MAG: chromosomal replication initiator protein DnaA [Flavobacteriaceae bacterium]